MHPEVTLPLTVGQESDWDRHLDSLRERLSDLGIWKRLDSVRFVICEAPQLTHYPLAGVREAHLDRNSVRTVFFSKETNAICKKTLDKVLR